MWDDFFIFTPIRPFEIFIGKNFASSGKCRLPCFFMTGERIDDRAVHVPEDRPALFCVSVFRLFPLPVPVLFRAHHKMRSGAFCRDRAVLQKNSSFGLDHFTGLVRHHGSKQLSVCLSGSGASTAYLV